MYTYIHTYSFYACNISAKIYNTKKSREFYTLQVEMFLGHSYLSMVVETIRLLYFSIIFFSHLSEPQK